MPSSAADRVADTTTVEILSDIRDLLGEIRDRLPEPAAVPRMASEPPQMASDDDDEPALSMSSSPKSVTGD